MYIFSEIPRYRLSRFGKPFNFIFWLLFCLFLPFACLFPLHDFHIFFSLLSLSCSLHVSFLYISLIPLTAYVLFSFPSIYLALLYFFYFIFPFRAPSLPFTFFFHLFFLYIYVLPFSASFSSPFCFLSTSSNFSFLLFIILYIFFPFSFLFLFCLYILTVLF
jgi:hypothetical protein